MPLYRKPVTQYRLTRKYKINDDYFENIDNEHKAYWLGFLMADGYVQNGDKNHSGRVNIHLQSRDVELLKKFKKDTEATYPIRMGINSYGTPDCKFEFRSQKMVEDLIRLGCNNKKSLTLKFPEIEEILLPHFIRGYFDGDGSICSNGNAGRVFKIISTLNFVEKLQNILVRECNLKYTKLDVHYNGINRTVRYVGEKQLFKIYNYLYSNASLFLERKKIAWSY